MKRIICRKGRWWKALYTERTDCVKDYICTERTDCVKDYICTERTDCEKDYIQKGQVVERVRLRKDRWSKGLDTEREGGRNVIRYRKNRRLKKEVERTG